MRSSVEVVGCSWASVVCAVRVDTSIALAYAVVRTTRLAPSYSVRVSKPSASISPISRLAGS